jgi:hypothetical protein
MEDLLKSFERFRDTRNEIDCLLNDAKYKDLNIRSIKGERFLCRDTLSDWYSQLTEEQKKLIAEFRVLFGSALAEDKKDKEYNLKNYVILNKNFPMKEGIIIEN